ncbi:oligosaccharide flippase family protein [Exiguobacterium sp. s129]|uniref:lipopolysaccharide biosynthesis protein n=1 Tax=Exiguobacterium sp. s129 TaxID=2751264 RepID=UPI001BE6AABC|nr:oligosaccharide flippase family protein [Exiguobacterium sp. s129]
MLKKISFVYGSNLILGILGIISVPILLNNLGLESYGVYAIYLMLGSYFAIFELGVIKHITRLIILEDEEISQTISTFYVGTIMFIIFFTPFIFLIITYILNGDDSLALLVTMFSVLEYIFFLPTKINIAYSKARKKFEKISVFNLYSGFFRYAVLIIGSYLFEEIAIILFLLMIRRLLDIKLSRKILNESNGVFKIKKINKKQFSYVLNIYKESIFLSATQIMQINFSGLVIMIISKRYGVETLGLFRSTFDILSKVWFISNGLGTVVFPYFASEKFKMTNGYYFLVSWLFYSFVAVILYQSLPFVNENLLNGELNLFEDSLLYVCISAVVLLTAQFNLSYEFLQAKGRYKLLFSISLFVSILFVILSSIVAVLNLNLNYLVSSWALCLFIQTVGFEFYTLDKNPKYLIYIICFSVSCIILSISWMN